MERLSLNRFIGGPPLTVALRLIVLSFVLGIVLSALGISPYDIVGGFRGLLQRILDLGFGTVEAVWRYFVLGAVIVVPVWFVTRLLRLGRGTGT